MQRFFFLFFFLIFWRPPGTYCVLERTQFQLTTSLCASNLLLDLCCSGLYMSCPPIKQKCQGRITKVTQLWLDFTTRCLCIYFNTYSVAFLYHTFGNMIRMSKKEAGLEGNVRSQTRLEFALLNMTPVWDNFPVFSCHFFFFFFFFFVLKAQLFCCQGLTLAFFGFVAFLVCVFAVNV